MSLKTGGELLGQVSFLAAISAMTATLATTEAPMALATAVGAWSWGERRAAWMSAAPRQGAVGDHPGATQRRSWSEKTSSQRGSWGHPEHF